MQVTTEQLVIDLYRLWKRGRVGHSTTEKIEWLQIVSRLDNLPDWHGRSVRTLDVPVASCGVVLRLDRTPQELVATFETVESPLGLGSFPEWRDEAEPADCNHCGVVLPLDNATGECHRCAGQPDDVFCGQLVSQGA
jgi:hypothetical protein